MKAVARLMSAVFLLFVLSSPRAFAAAQITMVNKSPLTLDLYVDGAFACGPVKGMGNFSNSPGLFCTASVTAGPHTLMAKEGEKVIERRSGFKVEEGASPTWTVNIPPPPHEGEDVTIFGDYMTDSQGWSYGGHVYLSSTVNDYTCTVVNLTNRKNVSVNVKSTVELRPNEKNVLIGEVRAIQKDTWWVELDHEKFKHGACPHP